MEKNKTNGKLLSIDFAKWKKKLTFFLAPLLFSSLYTIGTDFWCAIASLGHAPINEDKLSSPKNISKYKMKFKNTKEY